MTLKKKLLIGIIGAITIVILGFMFLRTKQNQIPSTFTQNPNIPNYYKGNLPVELKFSQKDFNFPKTSPVLDVGVNQPLDDSTIIDIANNAGFKNPPIVSEDVVQGKTFMWSEGDQDLLIYAKSRSINFNLAETPTVIDRQLSDEARINTAQEFISDRFPLFKNNLKFSFLSYYKIQGEYTAPSNKADSTIYQVNFSPSISNFKILTLDPQASFIFAWVLEDGTISRFQGIVPGNITKSPEEYSLKDYQTVVSESSKSVITSIDYGFFNFIDTTLPNIEKININKIDLVYLIDSQKPSLILPVYLLEGDMKIKTDLKVHNVQLYLPAIKNQ